MRLWVLKAEIKYNIRFVIIITFTAIDFILANNLDYVKGYLAKFVTDYLIKSIDSYKKFVLEIILRILYNVIENVTGNLFNQG